MRRQNTTPQGSAHPPLTTRRGAVRRRSQREGVADAGRRVALVVMEPYDQTQRKASQVALQPIRLALAPGSRVASCNRLLVVHRFDFDQIWTHLGQSWTEFGQMSADFDQMWARPSQFRPKSGRARSISANVDQTSTTSRPDLTDIASSWPSPGRLWPKPGRVLGRNRPELAEI